MITRYKHDFLNLSINIVIVTSMVLEVTLIFLIFQFQFFSKLEQRKIKFSEA